jgi:hypothetical protein
MLHPGSNLKKRLGLPFSFSGGPIMNSHLESVVLLPATLLALFLGGQPALACCPAPPSGKPVVNADQTVIILWDTARKTQHFIRKASFKSEADDFGFLVPTPAEPELEESGNEAFPFLLKLTEPARKKVSRPSSGLGCGCSKSKDRMSTGAAKAEVRVRVEKEVAGFKAVVLETESAGALVRWLKKNGYAFSPEIKAWAKPYIKAGWMITAFKVAKAKADKEAKRVAASALRMSFKTDRPLFPYREPDPEKSAKALGAHRRLLRIYFLAEARYRGELTPEVAWTGETAWANRLSPADRTKVLDQLKLPEKTGPATWWLTEFEDNWPYRSAPADVYFSRAPTQDTVEREPIIEYVAAPWPTDMTAYALAGFVILPPLFRRFGGSYLFRRRGGIIKKTIGSAANETNT